MKKNQFNKELSLYSESFLAFVAAHRLPNDLFKMPDHFAIKCANKHDYIETRQLFSEQEVNGGIWELPLDGRLLATAQLVGSVSINGYDFSWVEIMQPRPGKETEVGFVEHTEFYVSDFSAVEELLKQKDIYFERQHNPGHAWINIVIDEAGREIKLNNKLLADVVVWEKAQGMLKKVETEGNR